MKYTQMINKVICGTFCALFGIFCVPSHAGSASLIDSSSNLTSSPWQSGENFNEPAEQGDSWRSRFNQILNNGNYGVVNTDRSALFENDRDGMLWSTYDERRSESTARSEIYRVFSTALLNYGPIAQFRKILEPYTKPLEVRKSRSGQISSSFFGHSAKGEPANRNNSSNVFSVAFSLSGSNNLNVSFRLYDNVTLSFREGRTLDLRYRLPKSGTSFGLMAEEQKGYFVMVHNF